MHGVASQYVCDRFPPFDPDDYARVMVDLVTAGLKAGALNGVRLFDGGWRHVADRPQEVVGDRPQEALTP